MANSKPGEQSTQPEMKSSPNGSVLMDPLNSIYKNTLPVIHIDHKGRILFANKASFPLLRDWNCLANDYLPESLTTLHPDLLRPDADFELKIETKFSQFHLDIIGFAESGYIGMYGFSTVYKNEENAPGRIAVAAI